MLVSNKNFDLENFKRVTSNMINTSKINSGDIISGWHNSNIISTKEYSSEEINRILSEGSEDERRTLSRAFFYRDGFYSRVILHYATLLKNVGVLIPKLGFNKKINNKNINKRYYNASAFCDNNNFVSTFVNCSLKVLIDGRYYGVIVSDEKSFYLLDLPYDYCRTQYKDLKGNDLIEFDLSYFDSIVDAADRENALSCFPKEFKIEYKKYKSGKLKNSWFLLPTDISITFSFPECNSPLFLGMIPASLQYDDAVATEREKDKEEIKKIIVQKIPHNNQNEFLLEPDEVEELHRGAVGMLRDNKNVRVLTSYADVDAIVSKTSNDSASTTLKQMLQNVYVKAGVTPQLFASDSNLAIEYSIKNDIALMMLLEDQYSKLITKVLNNNYSNSNISFKYQFLPISYQNSEDYLEDSLKLGNSGYSFIIPALAMGITQGDLVDLKNLENDLLNLQEKLLPLSTSYTQSGDNKGGGVELDPDKKSDKTIKNEEALAKT